MARRPGGSGPVFDRPADHHNVSSIVVPSLGCDRVPNEVSDSAEVTRPEPHSTARIWLYSADLNSLGATLNPKVPGSIPGGGTRGG